MRLDDRLGAIAEMEKTNSRAAEFRCQFAADRI
jgi:hypothetical protein